MPKPTKSLVKNAADSDQVSEAEAKEKSQELRSKNDMLHVLSTPQGRRTLQRIMSYSEVLAVGFTGNSTTFFNCGKRAVGTSILNEALEASPADFFCMLMENHPDKKFDFDDVIKKLQQRKGD